MNTTGIFISKRTLQAIYKESIYIQFPPITINLLDKVCT